MKAARSRHVLCCILSCAILISTAAHTGISLYRKHNAIIKLKICHSDIAIENPSESRLIVRATVL